MLCRRKWRVLVLLGKMTIPAIHALAVPGGSFTVVDKHGNKRIY